ncbi:heavy metal-associated domain-containing protein [uncultured Agrococcus sp.]|uniref:heavy-metal-associated domain-containing protein n=1 Tax=uncultured Agrococcus sp. TaxID=382258 RepID=UPI0025F2EEDA|nr:heavy metal-associated domain-containing protein [uncultured Agrococcus sp.]
MKQDVAIGIDEQAAPSDGCCGGGCCGGATEAPAGVTAEVLVEGMTCSRCVNSVIEEVDAVPGVRGVTVSLVPGGQSKVFVQSDAPVDERRLQAAIAEAGYRTVLN